MPRLPLLAFDHPDLETEFASHFGWYVAAAHCKPGVCYLLGCMEATDVVVTTDTVALLDFVCCLQEMSFTHLSSVARTVSDMDDEVYQRLHTDRSGIA